MNYELANDRTYLAWLRTGIACIGLGFVVAKAALIFKAGSTRVAHESLYSAAGIVFILCGAVLVVVGYLQHRQVRRLITDTARPEYRWPLTTTAVAVVAAIFLAVLIGITA